MFRLHFGSIACIYPSNVEGVSVEVDKTLERRNAWSNMYLKSNLSIIISTSDFCSSQFWKSSGTQQTV